MYKRLFMALSLCLFSLLGTQNASADLLTNASFESVLEYGDDTLPNWFAFFGAGSTGTFSTIDAGYSGTKDPTDGAEHLSIANDGTADGFSGIFQDVAATAGTEYTFSFDARSNSGAAFPMGAEFRLEYLDASRAVIGGSGNTVIGGSLTDTYQNFSLTDTAIAGTASVRAVIVVETFSANGTAGNLFADNAVLTATAIPEPASAMFLGLGGLAMVMRRRR